MQSKVDTVDWYGNMIYIWCTNCATYLVDNVVGGGERSAKEMGCDIIKLILESESMSFVVKHPVSSSLLIFRSER